MTNQQKLENLTAQTLKLQTEIEELKQECKELTYWEPINKEKGWCIHGADIINYTHKCNRIYDKSIVNRGQVFKTKKEAQQELELQQATYRLKKAIWKANGGINRGFILYEKNFYIYYNKEENKLKNSSTLTLQEQPSWMYIENKNKALNLIETYKQDFLTYFGITN